MNEIIKDKEDTKESTSEGLSLKGITQAVYICQALSFLFGITGIAGIIINYLKKNDVKGTWLESHFSWQMRTFWFGLLWTVVGIFGLVILVGALILIVNYFWVLYRVIKGWLLLAEGKPIKRS